MRRILSIIFVLASAPLQANPASAIFDNVEDGRIVFLTQQAEKRNFGQAASIHYYNTTRLANSLIMQRSDRKRLYDHNLLMRAIFAGRILLPDSTPLSVLFSQALFIDLGSGILSGDGAPTVRDIYEDGQVRPYLSDIIATDIEDDSSPATRFITIYRKNPVLPFKVEQIAMVMDRKEKWDSLLKAAEKADTEHPIILRGTNSGPDLFYTPNEFSDHLDSLRLAWINRSVLYLFNRFVLLKKAGSMQFTLLGEMDPSMGTAHVSEPWRTVDWRYRTIHQAFRPRPGKVLIQD